MKLLQTVGMLWHNLQKDVFSCLHENSFGVDYSTFNLPICSSLVWLLGFDEVSLPHIAGPRKQAAKSLLQSCEHETKVEKDKTSHRANSSQHKLNPGFSSYSSQC